MTPEPLRDALETLVDAGGRLDAVATWSALSRPEVGPFLLALRQARAALAANPAPAGLDVERLRLAMSKRLHGVITLDMAAEVVDEYAALANTKEPDGG